jgi:hypothetical protein
LEIPSGNLLAAVFFITTIIDILESSKNCYPERHYGRLVCLGESAAISSQIKCHEIETPPQNIVFLD